MKNILLIVVFFFSSYVLFFSDEKTTAENKTKKENTIEGTKVYIRGLDVFENENTIIIKDVIEKYYGIECKIESPITTSYQNENIKDTDLLQEDLGFTNTFTKSFGCTLGYRYDEEHPINIYLTNSELRSDSAVKIHGICYGNTIYIRSDKSYPEFLQDDEIKRTAMHELSHSFGLEHCNDMKCIMSTIPYFGKTEEIIFCKEHMKEAIKNGFRPGGY
jgi:hypothetical protein